MPSDEIKAQLAEAKALIQQKRYADARKVLKRINDPTARKWEAQLNAISPAAPYEFKTAIYIIGGIAILIVGIIIGVLLFRGPQQNTANEVAAIPTQADLPTLIVNASATSTPIVEPTSTPSIVPSPTNTPTITFTPTITSTPTITNTPLPTRTRVPTVTPVPPQVGKLGPLYDDLYDETYNIEIELNKISYRTGGDFQKPAPGNIYVLAQVTVHNLGPGTLRSISNFSFQSKDGKGAIRDAELFVFSDCEFDSVDLTANGSVDGCVAFEIPQSGSVEIIYAPFQFEALKEGRYISFKIQ